MYKSKWGDISKSWHGWAKTMSFLESSHQTGPKSARKP